MASWKLNLNELLKRLPALRNPDVASIHDDTDPYRLLVQPGHQRPRPRRNVVRPRYWVPGSGSSSLEPPSSILPSPAPSSHNSHVSLTFGSSFAAGSLRVRDGTSTPGSGTSSDGRLINNHRPDEALVNMTFLLLLQGVCMPLLQAPSRRPYSWSIVHKQFSVSHSNPNNRTERCNVMTARTDGCLQAKRDNRPLDDTDTLAIIEVKPYRRSSPEGNRRSVQIQEGAEMAAWISTENTRGLLPTKPESKTYRRLLISQDFDEVYITIAEYDDLYVQHVRGDNIEWPTDTPEAQPWRKRRHADSSTSSEEGQNRLPKRVKFCPGSPVTPSQPGAKVQETTPQAPKRGMAARHSRKTEGFLVMHQFSAFKLDEWDHIEELILLLYTLTDYLTGKDAAQELQGNQP